MRPYRYAWALICDNCGNMVDVVSFEQQPIEPYQPVEADYQALTRASRYAEIYESRVDELKAGQ